MLRDVDAIRFQIALEKNPTVTSAHVTTSILFALLVFDQNQPLIAILWLAYMLIQQSARHFYTQHLLEKLDAIQSNIKQAEKRYTLFIILSALGWASIGPIFIDAQSDPQQLLFVAIFAIGMMAGAIYSLASTIHYAVIFVGLVSIPIAATFFFYDHLALAIIVFVFAGFTIKSTKDVSLSVINNIELNLHNQQLIEKLKKADQLKSDFLANMSHEIRTPMNAILGFIQILLDDESKAEKVQYLKTIANSGEDLLQIIDDILDFSKIERNELTVETIPFDARERIEHAIELFDSASKKKSIQLKFSFSQNFPKQIISDPTRTLQILNNLLSNAIKFSPDQATVWVHAEYLTAANQLRVSVKDEGIGMPQDKLSTIFDPFTQADTSTTRKFGGTGLGLSICAGFAKKLGGDIQVVSEPNKGSTFTFVIHAPIATTEIPKHQNQTKTSVHLQGHILIVEDNLTNQLLIKKLIEKAGLTYDIASDGNEAVTRFNQHDYEIILMDENMPNLNGIGATHKIRAIEAEKNLEKTPIIALTANSLKDDRERFLNAGMDDYLSKPINVGVLFQTLKKHLK